MSTIKYRLDLIANLVDTTTGKVVEEKNVTFKIDGRDHIPEHREEGVYLFLNTGREDFELTCQVYGYDEFKKMVRYEQLSETQPVFTVNLMPKDDTVKGEKVIAYRDNIPGISQIEAIILTKPRCAAGDYNARRQELSVFWMDQGRSLPDMHYGLLQGQKDTYTHIEVEQTLPDNKIKLAKPLEEEFSTNAPIYRVMYGYINEDGSLVLKARDNASEIPMIIRYEKDGEWYTLKCDFCSLEPGALKKAQKCEQKGGNVDEE